MSNLNKKLVVLKAPDTVDTVDTLARNTNKGRARSIFFTWNSYPDSFSDIIKEASTHYAFQLEVGKTGNKHVQGVAYFKNAKTHAQILQKFKGMHYEKVANWNAALNYVSKFDTAIEGSFESNLPQFCKQKLKDPIAKHLEHLRDFQTEIIELCSTEPDERSIYWFWEPQGNVGKTSLAKHLCIKYPDEVLFLGGKANDIKYGVSSFVKDKNLRVCIFHYTRSNENYVSYEALESIKDGIFFNGKYEAGMCLFNPPHVIVFANFEPDLDKLSLDRWKIREISSACASGPSVTPYYSQANNTYSEEEYEVDVL